MPLETVVPIPTRLQNRKVYWPRVINTVADGAGFLTDGYSETSDPLAVWGGNVGGGLPGTMESRNDLFCGEFPATTRAINAATLQMKPDDTGLDPSFQNPPHQRAWILRYAFRTDGAVAPDADFGLYLSIGATGFTSWPTSGGGGFGLLGDVAGGGQMAFVSTTFAAFPGNVIENTLISTTVIPSLTDWNFVVMQVINSAGGRNASFTLRINDVLVLTRNWVTAPALPSPQLGGAGNNKYIPTFQCRTAGLVGNCGPLQIEYGEFTFEGLALRA